MREHTPLVNLFSCLWFNEVDRFTSRDQISFGYTRDRMSTPLVMNMFKDCERRDCVEQVRSPCFVAFVLFFFLFF